MNGQYTAKNKLTKTLLRMTKDYSSFFYFTLEANENIWFYSTMPFEKGQAHRDIVVYCTPELDAHFQGVLKHCQKGHEIEVIESSIIDDLES